MKILQIHKYFSHKRGGGSVTAFFETKKLLEKKGNQVVVFSMKDENNQFSEYEKYFIDHFDLNQLNFWEKIVKIPKTIFNREAQEKLQELLDKEKPEIAHVHNIYHYLTPSIFHTLKKNNIPIVFKLSDYKVICPNYKLFNRGEVCEKCKGHKYYNCFFNRCIKNSWGFSFIGMIDGYVHHFLKSYEKVDLFLAPSEFMKKKCIEFGIPEKKIKILRNTMDLKGLELESKPKEKNYFLYLGRVSEEKGINKLIKAVGILKKENKLNKNLLYIAGDGPAKRDLKELVEELELKKEVEFLGSVYGEKRNQLLANSKFVTIPSVWYENSPNVISEAGLLGRPLIVSSRGGSKEMILEGESGLSYNADDENELAERIDSILKLSAEERKEMGGKQQEFINKINNEDDYYQKIILIYQGLIK